MNLVTVYRTFSSADAQLIRSLLESAEIPATVAHELASLSLDGYAMAAGGICVQVPAEHVQSSRELIETEVEPAE